MSDCQVCGADSASFYLCKPCTGDIVYAVREIPSLLRELRAVWSRQTNVYRTAAPKDHTAESERWDQEAKLIDPRLRTRDQRIALPSTAMPVNLDAADLERDVWDTLIAQVQDLRELAGTEPAGFADVVPWLIDNAHHARMHPGAESIHDELTYIRKRLESAVDRSPSRIYAGPCQHEGCPLDLYAWPGNEAVRCDGYRAGGVGCGHAHDVVERRVWLVEAVQEQLFPLLFLHEALQRLLDVRVPWETVRRWPRKSHRTTAPLAAVVEAGDDPKREPALYRGGDVVTLMLRHDERQTA